jgi:hypothetical protein
MKTARTGLFGMGEPYVCKFPWPEDCFVQSGGDGIIVPKGSMEASLVTGVLPKPIRRTAFFEAFPRKPDTFIRGEGQTIEEAETKAWAKFLIFRQCSADHNDPENFEKRGYTNGGGFCKTCGMFKCKCFEPWESCCSCGIKTYYGQDKTGKWWCEQCAPLMPEEVQTETQKMLAAIHNEE